ALGLEPFAGTPAQLFRLSWPLAQPCLQEFREQMVIAVPVALFVKTEGEQAQPVQLGQDPSAVTPAADGVAQLGAHAIQHRGLDQKLLHRRRLALEDGAEQVVGHLGLIASERKRGRWTPALEAEAGELQPGGPAFRVAIELVQLLTADGEVAAVEKLFRLLA